LQNYSSLNILPSRITFTTLLLTHFRSFFIILYQKVENGNHLLEKICIFAVLKLKTMVDDNKVLRRKKFLMNVLKQQMEI